MTQVLGDTAAASRRHPRARVNLPAQLAVGDNGADEDSLCVELSVGGMRVLRSASLEEGTPVSVTVGLGEDSRLGLEARVVWTAETEGAHELGLAFDNLTAADEALASLVADLRAQRSWGPPSL